MNTRIRISAASRRSLKRTAAEIFLLLCAAVLFGSCAGGKAPEDEDTGGEQLSETSYAAEEERFTSYTAEVTDGKDNFLLTVSAENGALSACLENNRYEAKNCAITAPEGFEAIIPPSSASGRDVCRVITNDIDPSAVIPDIIQFGFTNGETAVSRFYCILDGELREIALYNTDIPGDRPKKVPYLTRTSLYHSEPLKFIAGIVVDESAGIVPDIGDMVKMHTVRFIPEKAQLVGSFEELSEDNLLYFGYAYWGLANNAAVHFTETPFNVSDRENVTEIPDESVPEGVLYYYKVDDPRFSDTAGVMEYLREIFSEDTAQRLFGRAPQKYRDIDGELCTLIDVSSHDSSLGMLTFTSYARSQDGDSIIYRSRQEKYGEDGSFRGYVDGGDFVITKKTDWVYDYEDGVYREQHRWIVSSYRYPYS